MKAARIEPILSLEHNQPYLKETEKTSLNPSKSELITETVQISLETASQSQSRDR